VTTSIAMLLFPRLTQLDLTAPFEIFSRCPSTTIDLVAATRDPVLSEGGLPIAPTTTFDAATQCDLLFVPGGKGVDAAMLDDDVLEFLRKQAASAKWITSVCTGSLLLGAAGLLRGYRATSHWTAIDFLPRFGAKPVRERVVRDRNRITGAGVTAGIDLALAVAHDVFGDDVARRIQMAIEYDITALPDVPANDGRRDAVAKAAARLA
jgi:cyclohexyl-isocyanide hydratase